VARAYNALHPPVPAEWLALPEDARLEQVLAHHRALRLPHPATANPRLHAAVHVVVENQIALREPAEVAATLERLVAEGLDRHEAVHAIGKVVADELVAIGRESRRFDPEAYRRALRDLSAKRFREEAT
jgi:hypothetical protein